MSFHIQIYKVRRGSTNSTVVLNRGGPDYSETVNFLSAGI